jgi:hypothetical protein
VDHATPTITDPLGRTFEGHVVELSKQKFSSNVIEKSIRVFWQIDKTSQYRLLEELIVTEDVMETLVRESFANYVVQTALEHSPQDLCDSLWDIMSRIMPRIRGTPAGRRIAQKMAARSSVRSPTGSGTITPQDSSASHTPTLGPFQMPNMSPQQLSQGSIQPSYFQGLNGTHGGLSNGPIMIPNGQPGLPNGFGQALNGHANLAGGFPTQNAWNPWQQQAPRQGGQNGHMAGRHGSGNMNRHNNFGGFSQSGGNQGRGGQQYHRGGRGNPRGGNHYVGQDGFF